MQEAIHEIHNINEKDPIIYHVTYLDDKMTCCPNWHENIEILSMIDGNAEVTVDSVTFPAVKGDIIVVNSGRAHTVRAVNGSISYHCLILDIDFCRFLGFDVSAENIKEKLCDDGVYRLIEEISLEIRNKDKHYKSALKYLTCKLMVELYRHYSDVAEKTYEVPAKRKTVKKAAMFINEHCRENISIEEIADFVNVSKYYLCRIFKDVMGITMVEYINFRRCRKARRLLLESDMSISQVAEECGFENMSYFSKIYKKHMNILPSEQKRVRKEGNE